MSGKPIYLILFKNSSSAGVYHPEPAWMADSEQERSRTTFSENLLFRFLACQKDKSVKFSAQESALANLCIPCMDSVGMTPHSTF
mgnify:CR=1 FL=1